MEQELLKFQKVQKFIKRLYSIVSDPEISEITWNNNGTTILIPDKEKFRTCAMYKISKTKEYTAFLRSLHHYNFMKVKRTDDHSDEYFHKNFIKGREDLLYLIRRAKEKNTTGNEIEMLKKDFLCLQNNININNQNMYNMSENMVALQKRVEKQEQTISGLIEILGKVFRVGVGSENAQPTLKNNIFELNDIVSNNQNISDTPVRSAQKLQIMKREPIGKKKKKEEAKVEEINSPNAKNMPEFGNDEDSEDLYKDLFY